MINARTDHTRTAVHMKQPHISGPAVAPEPEQPILPHSRTEKAARPFMSAVRDLRVGDGGVKSVLMAVASFCEVFVDAGEVGRCRLSKKTIREASEWPRRKFDRYLAGAYASGRLVSRRTGRASVFVVVTGPVEAPAVDGLKVCHEQNREITTGGISAPAESAQVRGRPGGRASAESRKAANADRAAAIRRRAASGASVAALAREFEVSRRTVYRAVDGLKVCHEQNREITTGGITEITTGGISTEEVLEDRRSWHSRPSTGSEQRSKTDRPAGWLATNKTTENQIGLIMALVRDWDQICRATGKRRGYELHDGQLATEDTVSALSQAQASEVISDLEGRMPVRRRRG